MSANSSERREGSSRARLVTYADRAAQLGYRLPRRVSEIAPFSAGALALTDPHQRAGAAAGEAMLRAVHDASPDAFALFRAVCDARDVVTDLRCVYANPAAASAAGSTVGALEGAAAGDDLHDCVYGTLVPHAVTALARGAARTFELRYAAGGVPRVYDCTLVPVGDTVGITLRDVTTRRRAQDALLALADARLAEAQRGCRTRDEALAEISHDLRSPLGSILCRAYVLLGTPARAGDAQAREHVRGIERAALRMRSLVNDLLDSARLDSGRLTLELQRCAADALVADALDLVAPLAAEKQLDLAAERAGAACDVVCDDHRVLQVLANLLGNAIKFTPRGGSIAVRVARRGNMVEFSVADTGPGIPPEHQPRVFDRFWRAKETAGAGAGLGLFLARSIVEAHGGHIRVESEPGAGSVFTFALPAFPG